MEAQAYEHMARIERELWWYRGRRAICRALLNRYAVSGGRVLDVGCGTGYNLRHLLKPYGDPYGVEPSPEARAYASGLNVLDAPAERLPFPNEHFSTLSALDVIEHIWDDVAALQEWHRVLERGGCLLIYTPALPWLYGDHDRIVQHHRRYTKSGLTRKIREAGFTLQLASYTNMLVLPMVLAVRAAVALQKKRPHVEMGLPPAPINLAVTTLCYAEIPLILSTGLPIGLSLAAVAKKL